MFGDEAQQGAGFTRRPLDFEAIIREETGLWGHNAHLDSMEDSSRRTRLRAACPCPYSRIPCKGAVDA
jgi:hypothetical protein